jgi:uncharacterized membrane protein YhaH (DUF805 family)
MIKFQRSEGIQCASCSKIISLIAKRKVYFIVILVLFILSSSGMGFSLYQILEGEAAIPENNRYVGVETILALVGVILMFIFLLVAIYTFVKDFTLETNNEIT